MIEVKKLNRSIDALAKRTAKWRDDVQLVLVSCAQLAFNERPNVDPLSRLVHKLEGADRRTLVKWIEEHMPARFHSDVQSPYGMGAFKHYKKFEGEYDAVALLADAWWQATAPVSTIKSVYDMAAVVKDIRAIMKKAEKNGVSGLTDLQAFCGKFEQQQIAA